MPEDVKGLKFPIKFGPLGHLETVSGADKYTSNLKALISTELRQRIMAPKYGVTIMSMLFRNIDQADRVLISDIMTEAIYKFEKRVRVSDVSVEEGKEQGKIDITVKYMVRDSGEFDDLTIILGE